MYVDVKDVLIIFPPLTYVTYVASVAYIYQIMLNFSHKGLKVLKGIPCWLTSELRHKGVKRLQKLRVGAVGSGKYIRIIFSKI